MFLETVSPGSSTDGSGTVGRKEDPEDWPWALFVIIICLILLVIVVMIIRQKQKTQQGNDCEGQKRQKEPLDNGQKTSSVSKDQASKSAASNTQVETSPPPENKPLDEEQKDGDNPNSLSLSTDGKL